MSVVHTGVTDILCSYCGRPIVGGPFVTGNAGMYHPECTQSPFTKPMLGGQSAEMERRVAELERQIERMKPVVDAAVKWMNDRVTQTVDHYANESLDRVVREYQKEE